MVNHDMIAAESDSSAEAYGWISVISIASRKTAVTPLSTYLSYRSLELTHLYIHPKTTVCIVYDISMCTRLQLLQCVSNGVIAVLHWAIDIIFLIPPYWFRNVQKLYGTGVGVT